MLQISEMKNVNDKSDLNVIFCLLYGRCAYLCEVFYVVISSDR